MVLVYIGFYIYKTFIYLILYINFKNFPKNF